MTIRKRRQPTPHFKLPPPYSPVTGEDAALSSKGIFPFVAMMQVAAEDTHQNYVICRGHDIRYSKFYDYASGNTDKPGIAVAKPYGRRMACAYRVGQILPAILPMQSANPQPATVPWRVGKNPGVSAVSDGHPADLYEEVNELYTDEGVLIDYMFLEGESGQSLMVRATECILPGIGGSVQPQQWNSDDECWEDSDYDPFDIIDPNGWLLAVTDDCFKVDLQVGCGSAAGGSYIPSFPFGMTQLVRVLTQIDCGDCGEVVVVRKSDTLTEAHCSTVATACVFQACNMSYRPLSCDGQEYAIAHIIPGQCCLEMVEGSDGPEERCLAFLMPYPRPLIGKGTLTEDMCGGGATMTDSAWMDVCSEADFEAPTAASNTCQLHACSGTTVLYLFTVESGTCSAEVVAVIDVEEPDWITDIRCKTDSCAIEKKTKVYPYYGHFCRCTDQDDEWDDTSMTGEYIDVIVSGAVEDDVGDSTGVLTDAGCAEDGCGLAFSTIGIKPAKAVLTTKQVCVFCQKETPDAGSDIEITGLVAIGAAGADVTITGTNVDVITGIEAGAAPAGINVLTDADCDGCSMVFSATALGHDAMVLKKTTVCILCGTPAAAADGEGPDLVSFSGVGTDATLTGVEQDVITGLTLKSEVTSEGGGDEKDCETGVGLNLIITATTKTVCVFCPGGAGGTLEAGTDVQLDIPMSQVEPLTDAVLDCSGCPTFTASTTPMWAFCVGTEEEQAADECVCDPCEEESA